MSSPPPASHHNHERVGTFNSNGLSLVMIIVSPAWACAPRVRRFVLDLGTLCLRSGASCSNSSVPKRAHVQNELQRLVLETQRLHEAFRTWWWTSN